MGLGQITEVFASVSGAKLSTISYKEGKPPTTGKSGKPEKQYGNNHPANSVELTFPEMK